MTSNQPTGPFPDPIVKETRVRHGGGADFIIGDRTKNDYINLTTGEVRVARIVEGVRLDTTQATPIFGRGTLDDSYRLVRLYRTVAGKFFALNVEWADEFGIIGGDLLHPIEDGRVMSVAQMYIGTSDTLAFLRDWYGGGWLPRDEFLARRWAAAVLSADSHETLFGTSDCECTANYQRKAPFIAHES